MDQHIDACDQASESESESESEAEVEPEAEIAAAAVAAAAPLASLSAGPRMLSPRFRAASFASSRDNSLPPSHMRTASGDVAGRGPTPEMKANWQGSDSLRVC